MQVLSLNLEFTGFLQVHCAAPQNSVIAPRFRLKSYADVAFSTLHFFVVPRLSLYSCETSAPYIWVFHTRVTNVQMCQSLSQQNATYDNYANASFISVYSQHLL